jgi:hypothetical protein
VKKVQDREADALAKAVLDDARRMIEQADDGQIVETSASFQDYYQHLHHNRVVKLEVGDWVLSLTVTQKLKKEPGKAPF